MNLEELIYLRLSSSEALTEQLARFAGKPAVFCATAPDDAQEGWEGPSQYPKLVFSIDMQANEERSSAGTLTATLLCQNTTGVFPEAIEPFVKAALRDVLLKPESGYPYCFAWARTDGFTVDETAAPVTTGCDMRFDVLEYPPQETTDPDPVAAMNRYLAELYPECSVIGHDRLQEITEATAERPVIYCRLLSAGKSKETNTVVWMDGRIAVHILCPDSGVRVKMAAAVSSRLSLDGEVIMLDNSPMFIKNAQANYKSDYLKDGQVFVAGYYGLLRHRAKHKPLNAVNMNHEKGGKGWQKKA